MAQTSKSKTSLKNVYALLEPIIGRWITEGDTVGNSKTPSMKVVASDVYEWGQGKKFIIHYAYGIIGDNAAGGIEIIRFDEASKKIMTFFIDNQGEVIEEEIVIKGNEWKWIGKHTRATGTFSKDGKSFPVKHEKSDNGKNWETAINVTISKAE